MAGAARRPPAVLDCSICGRRGPGSINRGTGLPWCMACQQRWRRCTGCSAMAPVFSGTLQRPRCARCTDPPPPLVACAGCGAARVLRTGRCERCNLRAGLLRLLGDGGAVRPGLEPLFADLLDHERPATLLRWLARQRPRTLLADLGSGRLEIDHSALDALAAAVPGGRDKVVDHLRAMLVASGCLPRRDEHLAGLQAWTDALTDGHRHGRLLHRYAHWHVARRLRTRAADRPVTAVQTAVARRSITAAARFLDDLDTAGLTLSGAGQGYLDQWRAARDRSGADAVGPFLRWARANRLTEMHLPATGWHGPRLPADEEARWALARRLLHDSGADPGDRVAGLLVLLYAQHPADIAALTTDDVLARPDGVRIRLGPQPVLAPEPLAGLLLALLAARRGHAALADHGDSPWLFPGGRPGRPLSNSRLAERLRALGMQPRRDRCTAMLDLSRQLPAAMLARLLGIHITSAVRWQHASGGDWTAYAADYARGSTPAQQSAARYSHTSDT